MREHYRYITMVVGLLVAAAIIFSQSYSLHSSASKLSADTVQSDKGVDDEGQDQQTILSVTNLPTAPSISLTQEAFCLFEISFLYPESPDNDDQVAIPLGKFFSTIFSVIISPNAP